MDMNRVSESDLGMLDDGWMNQQTSQKLQEAKAKPHAQAHLLSPTDKCKVCNEPAAKHVHYGAMTCFSCRAFFRRSIQNKTAATYVCRRSKNCEINLKTRKNCQFCRYMRCIAVGMKPTWVLSEEERQRRFRKNREKQEQQGFSGQKKTKKSQSGGDSFSEFDTEYTLDSIESSLTDTLMSSPLLMDQALPQTSERSRENIPVILEKQEVLTKVENVNSPQEDVQLDNISQQFFNDILKSGPGPSYQHVLVKTESGPFQPKPTLESYQPREQKVFQQASQKVILTPTSTTQPNIVLFTSPSQYQQNISPVNTLSPVAHKSTIIIQPGATIGANVMQSGASIMQSGASIMQSGANVVYPGASASNTTSPHPVTIRNSACLSTLKPQPTTSSVQNVDMSKMRQNFVPSNLKCTPSVIVQPTPRFQPQQQQQQLQLNNRTQEDIYPSHHHQKVVLKPTTMQEFAPENNFPLEVGSFATIGSEGHVSPHSTYSATPSPVPQSASAMASSDHSNQNKQIHYKQPGFSQNIEPVHYNQPSYDGWDSNYEDDIFTSDEEEDRKALLAAISNEPEIKFSSSEYKQLEILVTEHDERYRSVNFGEELIKEMIMCSMFGIPVSTSAAINGYRLSVERITRIAHNLDCFTDLPKSDQNNLLKENADLLVNLRGAIFFDRKKKGVDQVLISMGIDDLQTIKTMFTPLLKENSMKHIDYKTFNSIQAVANPATETRYNFLQTKVADIITDDITTILVTYIILFSVDFCPLLDRRRVERTQDVYIRMLERYIYSKTPRRVACGILAKTLSAVTCLREMADIKKSRAINVNVKVP